MTNLKHKSTTVDRAAREVTILWNERDNRPVIWGDPRDKRNRAKDGIIAFADEASALEWVRRMAKISKGQGGYPAKAFEPHKVTIQQIREMSGGYGYTYL